MGRSKYPSCQQNSLSLKICCTGTSDFSGIFHMEACFCVYSIRNCLIKPAAISLILSGPISEDAQEIVLLVLLHYGQQQSHGNLIFSMELTKLIDCFSRTVVFGHTIPRHRHQQLHSALAEIRTLWPNVLPRQS